MNSETAEHYISSQGYDTVRPTPGTSDIYLSEAAVITRSAAVTFHEGPLFVGPRAVLRGDEAPIVLGKGTVLETGAVVRPSGGRAVTIEAYVWLGLGSAVYGTHIGKYAVVGPGAVVGAGSDVGEGAEIAAGAVVQPGAVVPPYTKYGVDGSIEEGPVTRLRQKQRVWETEQFFASLAQKK